MFFIDYDESGSGQVLSKLMGYMIFVKNTDESKVFNLEAIQLGDCRGVEAVPGWQPCYGPLMNIHVYTLLKPGITVSTGVIVTLKGEGFLVWDQDFHFSVTSYRLYDLPTYMSDVEKSNYQHAISLAKHARDTIKKEYDQLTREGMDTPPPLDKPLDTYTGYAPAKGTPTATGSSGSSTARKPTGASEQQEWDRLKKLEASNPAASTMSAAWAAYYDQFSRVPGVDQAHLDYAYAFVWTVAAAKRGGPRPGEETKAAEERAEEIALAWDRAAQLTMATAQVVQAAAGFYQAMQGSSGSTATTALGGQSTVSSVGPASTSDSTVIYYFEHMFTNMNGDAAPAIVGSNARWYTEIYHGRQSNTRYHPTEIKQIQYTDLMSFLDSLFEKYDHGTIYIIKEASSRSDVINGVEYYWTRDNVVTKGKLIISNNTWSDGGKSW